MRGLARCTAFLILAGAMAASAVWAQQGTTPLAVLVQPAEMQPIASQREFIGRAQAVDRVDLRARVQGFLGLRKFTDDDRNGWRRPSGRTSVRRVRQSKIKRPPLSEPFRYGQYLPQPHCFSSSGSVAQLSTAR